MKNIIVELIKQDMQFNQYIGTFRKLGIEIKGLELDLMCIIAELMGIKRENMSESWMEKYVTELHKCEYLSIEPFGNNLRPLAEVCYHTLLEFSKSNDDDLERSEGVISF